MKWIVVIIIVLFLSVIALTTYILIKHFQGKKRPLTSNVALYTALKKIASEELKEMDGEQVNWKATCEIMKALAQATLEMVIDYEKTPAPKEKAQERPNKKGGR